MNDLVQVRLKSREIDLNQIKLIVYRYKKNHKKKLRIFVGYGARPS